VTSRARTLLRRAIDVLLTPVGIVGYWLTGRTSTGTYRVMRRVHSIAPSIVDPRRRPAVPAPPVTDGALGPLTGPDLDDARSALDRDGFVVLDQRLDPDTVAALTDVAANAECTVVGSVDPDVGSSPARFDPDRPLAPRYEVTESTLFASEVVQELAVDEGIRRLAAAYLRCDPVNDLLSMWWSAPGVDGDRSAAAQQFHADRDRLSFVKLFAYLTDVGPGHGPHVYVRGSHRDRPMALRADRRFSDAQVGAYYGPGDKVSIEGPAGTVFLADTLGLHKGTAPVDGPRLVFQIEYATNLFGAPYETVPESVLSPQVRARAAAHPHSFQRLLG
jgi:hypothetical protein